MVSARTVFQESRTCCSLTMTTLYSEVAAVEGAGESDIHRGGAEAQSFKRFGRDREKQGSRQDSVRRPVSPEAVSFGERH